MMKNVTQNLLNGVQLTDKENSIGADDPASLFKVGLQRWLLSRL
jgi:hypothetical protein